MLQSIDLTLALHVIDVEIKECNPQALMKLGVTGLLHFLCAAKLKRNVLPYLVDPKPRVRHCANVHPLVRLRAQVLFHHEFLHEMGLPSKNDRKL